MKNCIITGVNGQLGQFLVKYLLDKEPQLKIIGTLRYKSYTDQQYIFDKSKITFEVMDLSDQSSIESLIIKYKPNYFINTAANAFVGDSWKLPLQHFELNTIGVLHQLEAIRKHSPLTRFFNMGSSEELGIKEVGEKQNENTPLSPRSPYGCSKAAARYLVHVYKESYNLYALQGITFNFESELRGEKYVTKKISQGIARIYNQLRNGQPIYPIELGNIYSVRSWQYAEDVADGIWRMLNQELYRNDLQPEFYRENIPYSRDLIRPLKEYVLSSNECHTVKEFIELAFNSAHIDGKWNGNGIDEYFYSIYGYLPNGPIKFIKINPDFYRPNDVTYLNGDSSAAQRELNWKPKIKFKELVDKMVWYDINHYKNE